jgi:hypothetical protein
MADEEPATDDFAEDSAVMRSLDLRSTASNRSKSAAASCKDALSTSHLPPMLQLRQVLVSPALLGLQL